MKGKDISGQRFGRLIALKQVPSVKVLKKNTSASWECICDCGELHVTRASYLRRKSVRSCGCLAIENSKNALKSKRPPGVESAISRKLNSYKGNAKKRNLIFDLTREEFSKLLISNCGYCGDLPNQKTCIYRSNDPENTLTHHGIDRIDNNEGYIKDNVISCCKLCNWIKRDMSQSQFISHIAKIIKHMERL